jgi:hypothetical protein
MDSDSSSDSAEDVEGDDTHKLQQMRQAAIKGVPLIVEIKAEYAWENVKHEAIFAKEFREPAPAHVLLPFQAAYKQIEQLGLSYGGGLPQSWIWTEAGLPREAMEVIVYKKGESLHARYGFVGTNALEMVNLPEHIRVNLPLDWSVTFGTIPDQTNDELTSRMMCITSKVDPTGKLYVQPWQIRVEKLSLRSGEEGETVAVVHKIEGPLTDDRIIPEPPLCAHEMPTFVETTRLKETQALLKFGRDSNWPLKTTVATAISPPTALSVTYDVDWSGLVCTEEGEISIDWCWAKFRAKTVEEKLTIPPAFLRGGVRWQVSLRKESNSLRVIMKEPIWTPEDPAGPPPMILFGPKAIVKIRTTAPNTLEEMLAALHVLYQGRYTIQEEVPSKTWALVGSIGDGTIAGEIPMAYRAELQDSPLILAAHKTVLEAGLRTQNYDKGMDKLVRKFDPDEEMSATVAVHSGSQGENSWSVHFEQGSRRCLLMDTVDGFQPEEVLWTALSAWVWFNPRLNMPRKYAGRLYFPDEATIIMTDCWNYFGNLSALPGFSEKTPICQQEMTRFSEGLRRLKDRETWQPQPTAEAPGKSARIAEDAAVSRLRPIPDGPNQWEVHRERAVSQSSLGLSMVGTELVPGLGSTGTCATSGSPPYT